ncbi:HNH endonuclease [Cryobacterium sp. HLT2-28]|nr:HNH endonuclease [Cryobacterium sp. HLT2-28]
MFELWYSQFMAGTPDPRATTASGPTVEVGMAADPAPAIPGTDAVVELSPVQRLAALQLALTAELAAVPLARLSDLDAVAVLAAVEDLGRSVDAARIATASEVDVRSVRILPGQSQPALPASLGCRDGVDVITRAARISVKETKRRTRLGSFVTPRTGAGLIMPPFYPAVAAALTAGKLGVETADVIVTGLERISTRVAPDDLHTAERALVACATGAITEETKGLPGEGLAFATDLIRGIVLQWQARLDPDGTAPTEPIRQPRSTISFGTLTDGLYPLRGGVTPELRGIMTVLFDTYLSARSTAFPTHAEQGLPNPDPTTTDTRSTSTEPAEPAGSDQQEDCGADSAPDDLPAGIGDDRTGGEKRADIVWALFDRAARDPATPTLGGAAPTVLVHVNATDLLTGTGVGWVDGVDAPVSLTTVKQLICTGGYQKILFGPNQEVLRLDLKQRLFTPAQRRAIAARDGGCIIPGCTCPPHWAELHHVIPWAAGGPTDIDNGVMLCWFRHHTINTSGWIIRMVYGTPQVKAPPWYDPTQTWHPANQNRTRTTSTRLVSNRP